MGYAKRKTQPSQNERGKLWKLALKGKPYLKTCEFSSRIHCCYLVSLTVHRDKTEPESLKG